MKSPLAKARDKWFLSEDDEECCRGTTMGQYLRNRLDRAFLAGANFTMKRIKELEAENKVQAEQIEELEDKLKYVEVCYKCPAKTELPQGLEGCKAKERIAELEAEFNRRCEKAIKSLKGK